MKYRVSVSVNISPLQEDGSFTGSSLYFNRNFDLEGTNFKSIADKIDYIYDTVETHND